MTAQVTRADAAVSTKRHQTGRFGGITKVQLTGAGERQLFVVPPVSKETELRFVVIVWDVDGRAASDVVTVTVLPRLSQS